MSPSLLTKTQFTARALFLAERIEAKAIEGAERIEGTPHLWRLPGGGLAAVFRYGVVVLFAAEADEATFLSRLKPSLVSPVPSPYVETALVHVDAERLEGPRDDGVWLAQADGLRLELLAEALGDSVVLRHLEARVSQGFEALEPMAAAYKQGRDQPRTKALVQHVGIALLSLHEMVGRAEVGEPPDVLWENPSLERLYGRLLTEYEVRERRRAVERKLEVVARTAETILDMSHANRANRVEWYIVILIVIELVLSLYDRIF